MALNKTSIEWTDYTWNPITGCEKHCDYCYAEKIAHRFAGSKAFPNGFKPTFHPERLTDPAKAKSGSKIFVCSMGELFGDYPEWTQQVFDAISRYPALTFQLLTKRPENISKYAPSPFPSNCWVGVSSSNQPMLTVAADYLAGVTAKIKFISFEPLLGKIDYGGTLWQELYLGGINWLIIGAQSKPAVMPKIEWVRDIVLAADQVDVPVFLKNSLDPILDDGLFFSGKFETPKGVGIKLRQEFPRLPAPAIERWIPEEG